MDSTLEDLVPALKRREDAAVELFLSLLWRPTCHICQEVLGDHNAAEDAAQDSIIKALKKIDQFREGQAFRPWFFRLAKNTALDHWRSRKRRKAAENKVASAIQRRDKSSEQASHAEAELAKLPTKLREVLTLHYFAGLSIDEVSITLGCPRGTAASRLARGKDELRRALAPMSLSLIAAFSIMDEASAWSEPNSNIQALLESVQATRTSSGAANSILSVSQSSLGGLWLSAIIAAILIFAGSLTLITPESNPQVIPVAQQARNKALMDGRGKPGEQPEDKKKSSQARDSDSSPVPIDDKRSLKNSVKKGDKTGEKKKKSKTHTVRFKASSGDQALAKADIYFVDYRKEVEIKKSGRIIEKDLPTMSVKTDKQGRAEAEVEYDSFAFLKLVVNKRSLLFRAKSNGESLEYIAFMGASGEITWRSRSPQSDYDDKVKTVGLITLPTDIKRCPKQNGKALKILDVTIEPYSLSLKGVLVSDEDGSVLTGARVSVGPHSCISKSDGQFELSVPSISEKDRLVIEAEGHATARSHLAGFFAEPQNKGKVALQSDIGSWRLKKKIRIKGYVVNEEDETIPNVQIQMDYQIPDRGISLGYQEQSLTLKTDPQGRFEHDFEPGGSKLGPYTTKISVSFSVKDKKYAPLRDSLVWSPDSKEAKFVLKKLCSLKGTVVAPKSDQSSPIILFVKPLNDEGKVPPMSFSHSGWTKAFRRRSPLQKEGAEEAFKKGRRMRVFNDGHFTMENLATGRIQVCAWSNGALSEVKVLTLKEGENEVSLKLRTSRKIHGRVQSPDGVAIPDAKVFAFVPDHDKQTETKIQAAPLGGLEQAMSRRSFVEVTETNNDGSFTLSHLGDGPYDLIAVPHAHYCSSWFQFTKMNVSPGAELVVLTAPQLGRIHVVAEQEGDEEPAYLDTLTLLNAKNKIIASFHTLEIQHSSRDLILPEGQYTIIARLESQIVSETVLVKPGKQKRIVLKFKKNRTLPTVTLHFVFPKKPVPVIEVTFTNAKTGQRFRELVPSPSQSKIKEIRLPAWVGANLLELRWKALGEKTYSQGFRQCYTQTSGSSKIVWDLTKN